MLSAVGVQAQVSLWLGVVELTGLVMVRGSSYHKEGFYQSTVKAAAGAQTNMYDFHL